MIQKTNNEISFYVNNDLKKLSKIDPRRSLLEYLRENEYYGSKYVCGEGGCGACTVVIAEYDTHKNMIKYRTANACLLPVLTINNKQIITVEGIGDTSNPHPVQVDNFLFSKND